MICCTASGSRYAFASATCDASVLYRHDEPRLRSRDNLSGITLSPRKGIFYAGTCTGPKTVPETLAEARSAALCVHDFLQGRA